jgi:hypothetical protein
MAAFRDLILGARIGSETRRDPMRKTMIAFAAALAVCTATMTSGTTAAFARGGGLVHWLKSRGRRCHDLTDSSHPRPQHRYSSSLCEHLYEFLGANRCSL